MNKKRWVNYYYDMNAINAGQTDCNLLRLCEFCFADYYESDGSAQFAGSENIEALSCDLCGNYDEDYNFDDDEVI